MWAWEKRRGWERSGVAANSWELLEKDVECLKDLRLNAYRFSIEWARLYPEPGKIDEAALARYKQLIHLLKINDMTPLVCLHHFTNPAWLMQRYPLLWADERVVDHFLEYAQTVIDAMGGSVNWWLTFNEPMVYALQGFVTGYFPPGERSFLAPISGHLMRALKNIAVAHRLSYRLLKRANPLSKVGVAQNVSDVYPYKHKAPHERAARAWDEFFHWMFLDVLRSGKFDADWDGIKELYLDEPAGDFPSLRGKTAASDPFKDILNNFRDASDTLDFIGINYYTRVFVRSLERVLPPLNALPLYPEMRLKTGAILAWILGLRRRGLPCDDMGHEIYPHGLAKVLEKAHQRYDKPLMVTENGAASTNQGLKADYLRAHLKSLAAVMSRGVLARGYFYWSLLDNYEWGSFKPKFGLYKVSRKRGFAREPNQAAHAYRDFILTQRAAGEKWLE